MPPAYYLGFIEFGESERSISCILAGPKRGKYG
jgi:hypothetical protein